MERRKLTKEDIDKVRNIEGFPIGTDEDIIALSDAPYYTACPNPFIEEFIKENGTPYDEATDTYQRAPYATDINEGKNDPVYVAHSYHTKVPHKAIMKYILYYTQPGDIIFDGFCGTGMTGVAAQACGNNDPVLYESLLSDMLKAEWGERKAIISDLSPAATCISKGYNLQYNIASFHEHIQSILEECKKECGWMYRTKHTSNDPFVFDEPEGIINYIIWSDVLICPNCGNDLIYWNAALDMNDKLLADPFTCPHCGAKNEKNSCRRAFELFYSDYSGKIEQRTKQVPVLIVYTANGKRHQKEPDDYDFATIKKIEETHIPYWFPTDLTPPGSNTDQPRQSHGIERIDQFYWKRSLYILAKIRSMVSNEELFAFTGILIRATKMNRIHVKNFFHGGGGWNAGYLKGTLYVPALPIETSILDMLEDRANTIEKALAGNNHKGSVCISTQSLTDFRQIPPNSVDYIFIDPPFGSNINYSELNCIWESWLRVKTNNDKEAIVNKTQNKDLANYQNLMYNSFLECQRILKPNRWITIEFHNSKNAVWTAIQEAILRSGFIIADVRTLNKKQGSFKQVTTTSAVKQDLVISAYKPKQKFSNDFVLKSGTEETAWEFVKQHLSNLPVAVKHAGYIEILSERQAYLLFDRMVAYHIMQGIAVPMDASDFYKGLDERFVKRDNMYFLPSQVNEYDRVRATCDIENIQYSLFVNDEKSAIAWLYQQLDTDQGGEPQTYAVLQPKFMQELKSIDKREKLPELAVLLEENFLKGEGGKWYVPDYTKAGDIAKLREKNLLKEFQQYLDSKGKLKQFRSEAIRAGFSKLWKEKNYKAIVSLAERLPEETVQEDPNLLMYYDISLGMV